jgi:hypothetical protein
VSKLRGRTVTVLAGAVLLTATLWSPSPIGLGTSSAAAFTCPSGWTVVTGYNAPRITQFCKKTYATSPEAYFIKVPSQHVGQVFQLPTDTGCTFSAGSSSNPDPPMKVQTVHNWLTFVRNTCGYNIGLAINGTFYDPDNSFSFPVRSSSPGYFKGSELGYTRYCFTFGGLNSTPGRSLWDDTTNTWASVGTEFTTAMPNGCANGSYHQVVGVAPSTSICYLMDCLLPRTYLGRVSGSQTVCILVGGGMTNSTATNFFSTFGCTTPVELDGGKSSEMSYLTSSGTITDAVTGCCGGTNNVPMSIIIWN